MKKTILITGATDGIGLETARMLAAQGHDLLLHGRSPARLEQARATILALQGGGAAETFLADLSRMAEVTALAKAVAGAHGRLDVLINNAGVFKTPDPVTPEGLDVRFAVNTLAPFLLTRLLLPRLGADARVINLSSAAQAPVDLGALAGKVRLADMAAYAQSKLALTMWSRSMGLGRGATEPVVVAVNPGSLLASKMVKEGFGIAGNDIGIGARILVRAALDDDFAAASGRYFDNDAGDFGEPHADALDPAKCAAVVRAIEEILEARA